MKNNEITNFKKLLESNDFEALNSYVLNLTNNFKLGEFDTDILVNIFLAKLSNLESLPQLFVDTVNGLGNWYMQTSEYGQAKRLYEVLVLRTPFSQDIHGSFAVCHIESGDCNGALKILDDMETHAELNYPNALNKALCYEELGENKSAIGIYKILEKKYREDLIVLNRLALCYKKVRLDKDAQKVFKQVLKIDKKNVQALNNLGLSEMEFGNFTEARYFFEKALDYEPVNISPLYNLSALLSEDEQAHALLEKVLDLPDSYINKDEIMYKIAFIKARCFEQLKEFKNAFDHFVFANETKFKLSGYDISFDRRVLQKMSQFIESTSLEQANIQPLSSTPIFIVGLPRSGTTLLERLLAAHQDIEPLGELNWVANVIGSIGFPRKLTCDFLINFRMQFETVLRNNDICSSHFIDKMPLNFRFIPIIQRALPEAKIIVMNRDRIPLVWSNYKQNFTSEGCLFAYDIRCLLNFHNLFENFISLFDESSHLVKITYDQLISKQDEVLFNLFDFLDLKAPQRLAYASKEQDAPVKTASLVQVRSNVLNDRDDQWRNYKPYLEEYLKSL